MDSWRSVPLTVNTVFNPDRLHGDVMSEGQRGCWDGGLLPGATAPPAGAARSCRRWSIVIIYVISNILILFSQKLLIFLSHRKQTVKSMM